LCIAFYSVVHDRKVAKKFLLNWNKKTCHLTKYSTGSKPWHAHVARCMYIHGTNYYNIVAAAPLAHAMDKVEIQPNDPLNISLWSTSIAKYSITILALVPGKVPFKMILKHATCFKHFSKMFLSLKLLLWFKLIFTVSHSNHTQKETETMTIKGQRESWEIRERTKNDTKNRSICLQLTC